MSADAYESCPACGQPVHPVAGRCRHCKVDLLAVRAENARAARLAAVRAQVASTPIKAPPPESPSPAEAPPAHLDPDLGPTPTPTADGPRSRWPARLALAILILIGGIGAGFAADRLLRAEVPQRIST